MTAALPRRLAAEAIGTAILVLFGAGAAAGALSAGGGELDYAGLGMIALAFSLAIAIAIYAFGTTSGAHINPAVTVSLALVARFPWRDVLPYVAAQLLGGMAGALLIVAAFGSGIADPPAATGTTVVAPGTAYAEAIVAEGLGTFVLLTAIMALAVDRRAAPGFAGLVIGLSVGLAILTFGTLTGASLNPARTFGPLLTTTIFGGDTNWEDFPIYVLGPLIGAAAAVLAYDLTARPRDAAEEQLQPPQGTQGDIVGRGAGDPEAADAERQGALGDVPGRRL